MIAVHGRLRVTGLHKLPSDREMFEQALARDPATREYYAREQNEHREEMLAQDWENWQNAWLVVVEYEGAAEEIDFSKFRHGPSDDPDWMQAAWEEKIIDEREGVTRAAFYLVVPEKTPTRRQDKGVGGLGESGASLAEAADSAGLPSGEPG